MSDTFPIQIPDRLPVRITPCPIVQASFETRFSSPQPWATMPGLLFAHIRQKYPDQQNLPLAQLPEEVRKHIPDFLALPQIQFSSGNFLILLGPRVVSLMTKPDAYPGWPAIEQELAWLVEQVKMAGFVGETERLGARFIDFFDGDVFGWLRLGIQINDKPLQGAQTDMTTFLKRNALSIRLQATNAAIVSTKDGPKTGSVLDIDASFGALEADFFANGLMRFAEAHHAIKGMFFGLIKPELLDTLHPTYE